MEELSIEEKARRYDEAIEIAKDCQFDGLALSQPVKDVIEHIFPEIKLFKKMEEEEIRLDIVDIIKSQKNIDGPKLDKMIDWLEKQGEKLQESIREESNKTPDKKPNKVKPTKFKTGDWIVFDKSPLLIYDICNNTYDTYGVKFEDGAFRNYDVRVLENKAHLWNIEEDAKDGDVLVNKEGKPFIFSGHFDVLYGPTAYCGIDCENIFRISEEKSWWTHREVYPATKEQRDKIEKAMLDAGYKWNKEKLKLEKI